MTQLDDLTAKLKALGAPGDHGYGTPAGDAIFLAHQLLSAARSATPTAGIAAVAAERRRQIEVEGWTSEHDDTHLSGELAQAAAAYALNCCDDMDNPALRFYGAEIWPWSHGWWKPSADPRRDLIKAGALIAAEIDRLDRMLDPLGGQP